MRALAIPAGTDDISRTTPSLLPLKLTPPPLREGVLLRPDLQALLSEVRLHPMTLVVAPAGYGKTTLLSQWAHGLIRTGAPVAWLTLDGGEREPALLLAYLIRAFQTVFPSLGADAWRVLQSVASPERDWPLVAGALCSDLQRKVPTAAFLFLDDLHLAAESAVTGQVLGYILRAAPPTLHLVAAARRAPTFAPLARMRTEGLLLELTQRDLHLAPDEARQILALQGVALGDDELGLLLARTEGWALSLQLAARALAQLDPAQRGAFVRALGGSQEQLLGYLASEVLADLPGEVIDFLRLAALPAHFDADLLAEVLAREEVPYLLRRAQALGLPLLPLDEQGDRLRFHPLWRELLLRGVAETVDQETLAALHRRFGRAFESRGALEDALEHYAAAGAEGELARALREHAWPLLQTPRREVVRRWLERLPATLRESDPDLLSMWGYSQIVAAPAQAVAVLERAAELFRRAGNHPRELRAYSDLAALLFWQARPADLAAIGVRAVRAANLARDAWSRGAALTCVTAMLATKGRYAAALRVARQASGLPLNPAWRWLLAMIVSTVTNQLGRPNEALAALDEALRLPQVDSDDRLRQNLLRQRAMARFEQGHVAEAIGLALDAHRHLGDYYRDGAAGFSAAQLALMLTLQGRLEEAAIYVAQARSAFHDMGALAPLASLQAIELYGMQARGQAQRACAAVGSVLRRLDEAEGYAADLRLRLLLALVLGAGGECRRALELAQETAARMAQRGYRLFLAAAQLYVAHLAGQCGAAEARELALREGWGLLAADGLDFVPLLPADALADVAGAALRAGIAPETVGRVLTRQIPEQAVSLLQGLLEGTSPAVRAQAARLLGDLGSTAAYPSLRALLKDKTPSVRAAAEDALSRLVYRPPYTLRIRTLGAFTIWRGDQEVKDRDWRSSKARQLFQLLITERGRALPRERVLDTLWPEMEPDAAANNLRVTINRLSKALEPERPDGAPPAYLTQQSETYTFNDASDYELDAADFASAVAEGQRAEQRGQRQAAVGWYRKAIELYRGPYLPDNMYEDWTVVERERLQILFNDAAVRLGTLLLDEGQAHEAIGLAWRVIEYDRAHEEAYRLLMRAHAALGERSTALRLYARCVAALREELGVEPLPETTALYNALREMH
ncbi:MAG TPA: BTAD domain-containing putative transcriptional regulator [Roseiflexaceae bacterium]|nr:BTAD domain-containing putative transcriptional regulator [Roseiflexaceae bacterium]